MDLILACLKKPTAIAFILFGLWTLLKPQAMESIVQKLEGWPAKKWRWALITGCLLTFALLAILKLRAHEFFHTTADLARLANAAWNTSQGYFLDSSNDGHLSLLANHFKPFLALLAPLFALWPDARVLLLTEALAMALAIPPLFFLVRRKSGSSSLAALTSLALVLSPYMIRITRFDAHTMSFCVPVYLWALWFWETDRRIRFLACLLAALTLKEEAPPHLAAIGLYLVLQNRYGFSAGESPLNPVAERGPASTRGEPTGLVLGSGGKGDSPALNLFQNRANWRWGLGLIAGGILAFFLETKIIAHFAGGSYWIAGRSYGHIFAEPHKALLALVAPITKLETIMRFLIFLGFAPILAGWAMIPMWASLLPHWLSSYQAQYHLGGHYAAAPLAFGFYAAGIAAGRYPKLFTHPRAFGCALILIGSGLLHVGRYYKTQPKERQKAAYELLSMIPEDAAVQAPNHLMAHLACRREIFQFPKVQFTANLPQLRFPEPDYVIFDFKGNLYPLNTREEYEEAAKIIRQNSRYELIAAKEGFELWKKERYIPRNRIVTEPQFPIDR